MDNSVTQMSSGVALGVFLLFCRVGGCFLIAPGLSAVQFPVQVRLFAALTLTLALAPIVWGRAHLAHFAEDPIALVRLIVVEGLIGMTIGALGRAFFSALESLATVTAQLLGLANPFGVELDAGQASAPFATLVTLGATAVLFAGDFHWEILRGLVASYQTIPIGADFDASFTLRQFGGVLGQSFLIAVRVASPFFLYSILINFTLSLVNRVTPQIQVFFVAPPFVIAGGFALFYFVVRSELSQFMDAFASWLTWG